MLFRKKEKLKEEKLPWTLILNGQKHRYDTLRSLAKTYYEAKKEKIVNVIVFSKLEPIPIRFSPLVEKDFENKIIILRTSNYIFQNRLLTGHNDDYIYTSTKGKPYTLLKSSAYGFRAFDSYLEMKNYYNSIKKKEKVYKRKRYVRPRRIYK